ncbi:hypothetical protein Tco_1145246 [Tanacetum coccineum]
MSPTYVPDPIELDEHVPVYVPEPEHPEYHVPTDDDIQVEDQPYTNDASPTAESPGHIEDPEEDHIDDLTNGDDGDDEPSDDDETDDEDEDPTEDEEEEEHIAPADPSAVPVVDPVPSAGDTKAFETDEYAPTPRSPQTRVYFSQTRLRRAWKTIRLKPLMAAMIRTIDDIPEEDMPPRRRFVLAAPPPRCDVAESSATVR